MKIYTVIIEDRHTDVEAYPFSTAEKAMDYAKEYLKMAARRSSDIEEEKIEGWLYYARYSCEDDSVRVVEYTLDSRAVE